MGVKTYFLLTRPGYGTFVGIKAYKMLETLFRSQYRSGSTDKKLSDVIPAKVGWRKRIIPLFREMYQIQGSSLGDLKILKTANPWKDPVYRVYFKQKKKSQDVIQRRDFLTTVPTGILQVDPPVPPEVTEVPLPHPRPQTPPYDALERLTLDEYIRRENRNRNANRWEP